MKFTARSTRQSRASRSAAAVALGLAVWLGLRGHDGYDLAYALLWGDELAHGRAPTVELPFAPTPHPLANLAALLTAPLGRPASAEALRLLVAIAFGAVAVAAYAVGRALFERRGGVAAGLLAAVVLLTRPQLLAATLRGSIDIPALALTLFALAAVLRRRFVLALILLALAGLLRPEAWLLSLALAAYWRRRQGFALALAAPLLWFAADLLATGDPLHSFTGTRALAEELNRPRSAPLAPLLVPRLLTAVIGLPLVLAGAAALVALSETPTRRFRTLLVTLLLGLATFVAIGAAGLPLLARYLLPPAALLVILAAGVAATGTSRLPRAAVIVALVLAVPATVTGLREVVNDSRGRRALQADLRALTRQPAFRRAVERCPPLSVATYRQVPVLAYAAHLPAAEIRPEPDGDLIVLPRSARAAEALQSASDAAPLLLQPPPGFGLAAQTADWALAARC